MESLKHFGMLALFLAYLLLQVSNTYAEGIAELKREEAEMIKKIYANKIVDEADQVPTRLSVIERGIGRIKNSYVAKGVKYGFRAAKNGANRFGSWVSKKWRGADHPSDNSEPASKSKLSEFMNVVKDEIKDFKAVFPGTQWCGDGNTASKYEDLGLFKKTDACCRQHDNCPLGIPSGESLGPLINNAGFTRSWCPCDQDFYNCLKAANNPVAREIGNTYFSLLGPQCIDYNYPAKCTNLSSVLDVTGRKCLAYEHDQSQEKRLQWKDSPNYIDALNG